MLMNGSIIQTARMRGSVALTTFEQVPVSGLTAQRARLKARPVTLCAHVRLTERIMRLATWQAITGRTSHDSVQTRYTQ